MRYLSIIAMVCLLLIGCKKKKEEKILAGDSLTFGHFYGMCVGEECTETYRLTDEKLFEDSKDTYGCAGPYEFYEMPTEYFEIAASIPSFMPAELLASPDTSFGSPDIADGGGLFVQYKQGDRVQTWTMDIGDKNPAFLHDFVDLLNEKIKLLQE